MNGRYIFAMFSTLEMKFSLFLMIMMKVKQHKNDKLLFTSTQHMVWTNQKLALAAEYTLTYCDRSAHLPQDLVFNRSG
jgi:hypothetical protein